MAKWFPLAVPAGAWATADEGKEVAESTVEVVEDSDPMVVLSHIGDHASETDRVDA